MRDDLPPFSSDDQSEHTTPSYTEHGNDYSHSGQSKHQTSTRTQSSEPKDFDRYSDRHVAISIETKEKLDAIFTEERFSDQINDVKCFIYKRAKQHQLDRSKCSDIFSESYIRLEKILENKGIIHNIFACFKSVAFNIIREERRKQKKQKDLTHKSKAGVISDNADELMESLVDANVLSALGAFQSLTIIEQRIFHHWKISDLPWKEVCMALAQEGFLDLQTCISQTTINRIRRRGTRILTKLKAGYH